jgi:branched-chain amino acid transport system substrate-binding protein
MRRTGLIPIFVGLTLLGINSDGIAQTAKVGAVVPLTGRYASLGAQVRAGYEIGVEHANAGGGVTVGGKKIPLEMVLLDDESDATKTVARLETLAVQGVVAYLGGAGSDLHAAAASIAERNRIPYLGIAFALYSIHQQGFRYLFSPFEKSPGLAKETYLFLNASIPEPQRPKKVGLFLERTDWGKEIGAHWESFAKDYGYQIVVKSDYAPGSKDFSDLVLKAKAVGAEAIFALPTPPDGMALFKQMKELDFNAKAYMFIRAPDSPVWTKNLGKDGDYVLFAPGWHYGFRYPKVAELNESHRKRVNRPADVLTGPAYACIQILADSITRAGAVDRGKIRDAIAATSMTTVLGPVRFGPDGVGEIRVAIPQWLKGKQELVWPREFATAPFGYPAPPFNQR